MTLGLTGGIGMGKSTADQCLRQHGIPVVDTDVLARELVEPGCAALDEIVQTFGAEMVGPDRRLRRDVLAARVFSDPGARSTLEGILHPRIRSAWRAQVETWRSEAKPVAVVVIPLLFETGAEKELDGTICVACSTASQRERLQARGWSPAEIEARLQAQWPIQKKMDLSSYVVWSEGGIAILDAQLARLFSTYLSA